MMQDEGEATSNPVSPAGADSTGETAGFNMGLWLVGIIATAQAIVLYLPSLLRADLFFDDARQHIWWTYRFADPALFPNDPIAQFYSWPVIAPYGFQSIFRMLSPWMDATVLSELIAFGLAIPVMFLAWQIGKRMTNGARSGAVVGALIAVFLMLNRLKGGFPRTFATPILMLGVWALLTFRYGWLGISLILAGLFYPLIGVNVGLLAVVVLGARLYRERRLPAGWIHLVALGMVALGITVYTQTRSLPAGGQKTTLAEATTMAEFGPDGRSKFFYDDPIKYFIESSSAGAGVKRYAFVAVLIVLAVSCRFFPALLPFEAWAMAITSFVAFAIAHATLFTMYLPNRYLTYSLGLFLMMFLAALLPRVWEKLKSKISAEPFTVLFKQKRRRVALTLIVGIIAVGVVIQKCHVRLHQAMAQDQEAAFAFLKSLPKDSLIAAHPGDDAGDIPLRTQRSVLASFETDMPFYPGFYHGASERTFAELAACYATDWSAVDALRERYGVQVFLVNRQAYQSGDQAGDCPSPFQEVAQQQLVRGRRKGFVLENPPANRVLFQRGDYSVVSLKSEN